MGMVGRRQRIVHNCSTFRGRTGSADGAEAVSVGAFAVKVVALTPMLGVDVADPPTGPADVSQLALPGANFYPESLHAGADGTLYVGSIGTGQVVKFAPGSTTAAVAVAASSTISSIAGVLVDDTNKLLYACVTDNMGAAGLRSYNLADGSAKSMCTGTGLMSCNDMGFDGQGNLYMTDPKAGAIFKLATGGTALTLWIKDTTLAPTSAQGFGADGIAWDGATNLYVNNNERGTLLRIPILGNGNAGAIAAITVTPSLYSPDGMRMLTPTSYVTVENNAFDATKPGRLVRIDINGTAATKTVLSSRLDQPTSVVKVGNYYWVSEGQLGQLFVASPMPRVPFLLERIAM